MPETKLYACLACGLEVRLALGDDFPCDTEECSHEWEDVAAVDAEYERIRAEMAAERERTPVEAPDDQIPY